MLLVYAIVHACYGYNNVVININFAHDVKIAQIVAMHSEMILSEA